MKNSTKKSRRHRNIHSHEQGEQKQPFFSKSNPQKVQKKEDSAFFQPKLTIGQPGDKYEKEADSMADAVVSKSATKPTLQQKEISNIQRTTLATPPEYEKLGTAEGKMEQDKLIQEKSEEEPELQTMQAPKEEIQQKEEEETVVQKREESEEKIQEKEEEETAQMKPQTGGKNTASPQLSQQIDATRGHGNMMSDQTRGEMENAFGTDFSNVNIHTNASSVEMNQSLGAQAFTHGKDVYFNAGKYRPETTEGKRLLAHELTHVVQQGGEGEKVQKFGEPIYPRAGMVSTLSLKSGKKYIVKASDLTAGDEWDNISKSTGIVKKHLILFNMAFRGFYKSILPDLKVGTELYLPSGDEITLYYYYEKNGNDLDKATQDFGKNYANTEQRAVMNSAIDRTTGEIGEGYGADDKSFRSPNTNLGGRSDKKKIRGQVEYKINWASERWKCNAFVQDAVYQAGYKASESSAKHYTLAGRLHKSKNITQVKIAEVLPGTMVQYYGGGSSNSSHNMIVTSFISKVKNKDGTEDWSFTATGGSKTRAQEDYRAFKVYPKFNDGYTTIGESHGWVKIRFFKPNKKR